MCFFNQPSSKYLGSWWADNIRGNFLKHNLQGNWCFVVLCFCRSDLFSNRFLHTLHEIIFDFGWLSINSLNTPLEIVSSEVGSSISRYSSIFANFECPSGILSVSQWGLQICCMLTKRFEKFFPHLGHASLSQPIGLAWASFMCVFRSGVLRKQISQILKLLSCDRCLLNFFVKIDFTLFGKMCLKPLFTTLERFLFFSAIPFRKRAVDVVLCCC